MTLSTAIRVLIQTALAKFGYQIKQIQPEGDANSILQPWYEDDRFKKLLWQIKGRTLVDEVRCYTVYQFAEWAAKLPGDVAEAGVYRGGTARLLSKTLESTDKLLHLFDTFSGMPSTDPNKDIHKEGDFSDTSLESVKKYLHDCKNVRFYQGVFPATSEPVKDMTFSLAHIDVDIYQSVMDCCLFFYPRLQKGGIMLFDDYGFRSCPGAKIAVDEFFSDKPEDTFFLPTGQCFIIRL